MAILLNLVRCGSVERDGEYVGPRCVAGKFEPIPLGDNKQNWVHGGQPKLFAAVYSQFHYFTSSSCFHPVHDALSFIHAQQQCQILSSTVA